MNRTELLNIIDNAYTGRQTSYDRESGAITPPENGQDLLAWALFQTAANAHEAIARALAQRPESFRTEAELLGVLGILGRARADIEQIEVALRRRLDLEAHDERRREERAEISA